MSITVVIMTVGARRDRSASSTEAATGAAVARLRAALGDQHVITDPDVLLGYSRDAMTWVSSGTPVAAVLPADTAQVREVVRICAEAGLPIVPRGAGSGLSGGVNAPDGCVVLGLARMNAVLEIDGDNQLAVVQPGVINQALRAAVAEHGLFYPPDPASYDWCTLGGNVATNAGGLCCVKYGVTADFVLGLEVVLADGEVLRTGRRTVKGVAGYDLTRLFVGSEGTLGVITEITVRLRGRPHPPSTLVAGFDSVAAAGAAVTAVVRAGIAPSMMEIMDRTAVAAFERSRNTQVGDGPSAALLLCQSDAGGAHAREEIAALHQVCAAAGATFVYDTDDPAEGELLLEVRRAALPALAATASAWLTDDVCVPRSRIADLITGCEAIGERQGLTVALVGHAGDGNMHPTLVYDGTSAEQARRAREAFDEILALGLALGGTVTGEHGIGRLKQDWLARELGAVGVRVHRDLKRALDPVGLFNPGAVLPA
jgi:glycolate oxidase